MGVFSRFLRRSSVESTESTENATVPAPTAEASETVTERAGGAVETAAESPVAEGVEIPRQQSADEAADSETGEGARS